MEITHEWIGIIGLAGAGVGFIIKMTARVETLQKMFEMTEKARSVEREDFKEFKRDIKDLITHLENTVKQGQTALRIIIDEHTDRTNEKIDMLEKSMHNQHISLQEKIMTVERQLHEQRDQMNKKLLEHQK